jgi:hypothetical protein
VTVPVAIVCATIRGIAFHGADVLGAMTCYGVRNERLQLLPTCQPLPQPRLRLAMYVLPQRYHLVKLGLTFLLFLVLCMLVLAATEPSMFESARSRAGFEAALSCLRRVAITRKTRQARITRQIRQARQVRQTRQTRETRSTRAHDRMGFHGSGDSRDCARICPWNCLLV